MFYFCYYVPGEMLSLGSPTGHTDEARECFSTLAYMWPESSFLFNRFLGNKINVANMNIFAKIIKGLNDAFANEKEKKTFSLNLQRFLDSVLGSILSFMAAMHIGRILTKVSKSEFKRTENNRETSLSLCRVFACLSVH